MTLIWWRAAVATGSLVCWLAGGAPLLAQPVPTTPAVPTEAPSPAPDLPSDEVLVLRAELLRREATMLDLRRQLALERAGLGQAADQALAEQAEQLERLFRAVRQPPAGAVWDWQTLTFRDPARGDPPEGRD